MASRDGRAEAFIGRVLDLVARRDFDGVEDLLGEEAVLHPPRHHRPVTDRRHIAVILASLPEALQEFRYERCFACGDTAVMEFKGRVGEVVVHGLDLFTLDEQGKIRELTVFARPTSAHEALAASEDALVRARLGGR